ncbi:MAG: winged helix domain-containing protein, partial [Hafnia sp.]
AIIDEEMEPGDILYIPPGFPHEGYALENSLNYSVGFRAPSGRELISGFADFVLANELGSERYSDPDLVLRDNPSEVQAAELEKLRGMMISQLQNQDNFNLWFGEFVSQSRHELDIAPPEPPYQVGEIYELLQAGESLERLGGLRVINVAGSCFVNGEVIVTDHAAAAHVLAREYVINSAMLGDALEDPSFLATLAALINSGYWFFID